MLIFLAKIISWVLNPLVVLLPVPYILVAHFTKGRSPLLWMEFSFLFMLIAAFLIALFVFKGYFSDLDVSKKEERPLLFLLVGIITVFYLLSLFILSGPIVLYIAVLAITVGLLILYFVSHFLKASIHVVVLSSFLLGVALIYKGPTFFLFLLLPLVMWSRIKLKRHTLKETIAGLILGLTLTIAVSLVVKLFIKL
jgi:membrane-associated phospholipid phosphatase